MHGTIEHRTSSIEHAAAPEGPVGGGFLLGGHFLVIGHGRAA
jgi:hypothetical protein